MEYQVNLMGTQAKKAYKYLFSFGGWVLLFVVLWFKGCSPSTSAPAGTKITIPAVTNTVPAQTEIVHVPVEIPKWYRDRKTENKLSNDIIEMYDRIKNYQEEIDNMHSEYAHADSLQKVKLYAMATELKKFESNFEDENIKLTVNGIIGGNEVKEITPTYTIKERKVDVAQKQLRFRMLAGVGLGNSLTFDKPLFNANIGFQNAKGNVLRFSFDTEKRIMIGYDFSLFKISR